MAPSEMVFLPAASQSMDARAAPSTGPGAKAALGQGMGAGAAQVANPAKECVSSQGMGVGSGQAASLINQAAQGQQPDEGHGLGISNASVHFDEAATASTNAHSAGETRVP